MNPQPPATEYAAAQTLIVSPEAGEIARKSVAGQDVPQTLGAFRFAGQAI